MGKTHADRVRLKQILLNLLSNAVKFTPEDGTVSVECTENNGFAKFCVSDTGLGIPEQEHESIFNKFHQVGSTTKGVREGTGVGTRDQQALSRRAWRPHLGRKYARRR